MSEIHLYIIELFVMIIGTIITYYIVPFLKAKAENSQYAEAIKAMKEAVKAAEQKISESGQGKAKKAYVLSSVSKFLESKGIHITEDQLEVLLEAAVWSINNKEE